MRTRTENEDLWNLWTTCTLKQSTFPFPPRSNPLLLPLYPRIVLRPGGAAEADWKKHRKQRPHEELFVSKRPHGAFAKNPRNLTVPSSWIEHVNPCRAQEKLKRRLPAAQIAKPNKQTTFKLTRSSENIGYLHGILVRRLVVFTLWNNQYGSEANREFCFLDNDAV